MPITTASASGQDVLPFRVRYRTEARGQIVHDSIHQRAGWTMSYLLQIDNHIAGFGSVAIAGPWKDKPTVFEFYLLPEHRGRAFDFFEAFVAASGAHFFEVLHTYGRELVSEKIVFRDELPTLLPGHGATLKRVTSEEESARCFEARAGESEWALELDEKPSAPEVLLFTITIRIAMFT